MEAAPNPADDVGTDGSVGARVELNALADARLNDGQAIVKVSLDEL